MSEKCYYGYVRPKLPNHPWSLEKIPLGKSILTTSRDIELKSKKYIPFDIKVTDDIGLTLNQDGTFTLPIGRYLVEVHSLAELPVAGSVTLSLGDHIISNDLLASNPTTVSGMSVMELTEPNKSIGVFNVNKDPIKLSDNIIVISKL